MGRTAVNCRKRILAPWLGTALLYSLFFFALLSPLLLLKVQPVWDALDLAYPAFVYLSDSLKEGRLPLWDPYTNCGFPFHADSCVMNPLAILLGLFLDNGLLGFILLWVLHWWWGGLGMFAAARFYGATPAGGLVAAATYSLSGFFLGHAEHTSFVFIAAWLPWIFFLADKGVTEANLSSSLLAGLALGLCGVGGGYPVLVAFTGLSLAFWLMFRHLSPAGESRPLKSRVGWIVITLAVAALILVMVWAPLLHAFFIEGEGYTDRTGALLPQIANYSDSFSFAALTSIFFPYATLGGISWMHADVSMTNAYMGMLTLPLAATWFCCGNGNRRPWWLLAFVIVMFVISLGGQAGLRTLLYHLFPPLRFMRFSAPFRIFWIFPLTLAAGLGFSQLLQDPSCRRVMAKLFLCTCALAVAAAVVVDRAGGAFSYNMSGSRIFLPAVVGILGSAPLIFLWRGRESGGAARFLPLLLVMIILGDMGGHLYANQDTVWNKNDFARFLSERLHQARTLVSGEPPARIANYGQDMMNVQQLSKKPVVKGYVTMKSRGFNQILLNSRFVEVLSAPYRFWLSPGVTSLTSLEGALATLSRTGGTDAVPVFVASPPADISEGKAVPGAFGKVRVDSYAPERIVMTIDVPGVKTAFLASTERYAAGWKATIDGVLQPVQKTNLYFRGLVVPAGHHRVVWSYEPERLWLLLMLSFATIVLAAAVAVFMSLRERKDKVRHQVG